MIPPRIDPTPYAHDPIRFIDDFVQRNEKGRPWRLADYQRRVIRLMFALARRIRIWSELKKSGKTFLAAVFGLWWAFVTPSSEVIAAANDLEQSASRVFSTMLALIEANPALKASVKSIKTNEIKLTNGTRIICIASEYRSAAGARHSLVIFDELWGYISENAQRLYEELTPPPTEPDAWVLIVTYAGFIGESKLLEGLYQRGLSGLRVDNDLEVYDADDLLMFWSHTARQPWQTEAYYDQQRRSLRPATFLRLHENRWVTSESTFITDELWDPCVDVEHHPVIGRSSELEYLGVDVAPKHDNAGIVRLRWNGSRVELAGHRIWKPTPADPLDLEATIEAYLREVHATSNVARILVDPYQMHRSIMTLKRAGLPIEEFPQTVPNLTLAGQTLFDLLTGRNLRLYPSAELRQQALSTVAIESSRGWRIAKERTSKKIDAIVALAMAAVAAMNRQTGTPTMWNPFTGEVVDPDDQYARLF